MTLFKNGLVKEFEQNYQNAKKENVILDFHDLEHFALKILVEKTEGKIKPSQTALELSQLYQEVILCPIPIQLSPLPKLGIYGTIPFS